MCLVLPPQKSADWVNDGVDLFALSVLAFYGSPLHGVLGQPRGFTQFRTPKRSKCDGACSYLTYMQGMFRVAICRVIRMWDNRRMHFYAMISTCYAT